MYAFIVEIKELFPHGNADKLQLTRIFGNTVVVGLDVQIGDVGVFIATDSQIGEDFGLKNEILRMDYNDGKGKRGYIDATKRNIKAIRLRGERSEGLFMSLDCLAPFGDITKLKVGEDVDTFEGTLIAKKYIPRGNKVKGPANMPKKATKDLYPFFAQHKDTSQFMYNLGQFKEGDQIVITGKLHGTSQRTGYMIKEIRKPNWFHKLLKVVPESTYELISGTRRVVLDTYNGGFYGNNGFRSQWHEVFRGRLLEGEEVFYEVVGFHAPNSPIMGRCSNDKGALGKDFVKKYGKETVFSYGCNADLGESDIYIYRMNRTFPDGTVVEYPWHLVKLRAEQMGIKVVPELATYKLTKNQKEEVHVRSLNGSYSLLTDVVSNLAEGPDFIDPTHVREGVVVRIENRQDFSAYKHKGFEFKVISGIIAEKTTDSAFAEEL